MVCWMLMELRLLLVNGGQQAGLLDGQVQPLLNQAGAIGLRSGKEFLKEQMGCGGVDQYIAEAVKRFVVEPLGVSG